MDENPQFPGETTYLENTKFYKKISFWLFVVISLIIIALAIYFYFPNGDISSSDNLGISSEVPYVPGDIIPLADEEAPSSDIELAQAKAAVAPEEAVSPADEEAPSSDFSDIGPEQTEVLVAPEEAVSPADEEAPSSDFSDI